MTIKEEALELVKKIEAKGYVAYIVGGFVRDYILGIETTDVDIATSAPPKDIRDIFNVTVSDSFGSIRFRNQNLNVDVTTFRKEFHYDNRRPVDMEYTQDILTDLKRRDFTINAICMDSDGRIYDPLEGALDLEKKVIRVIGDIDSKFREDPLRIMRALRLAILYDFTIEDKALSYIISHKDLLMNISYERKRYEIDKILFSKKAKKGLEFLKRLGFLEVLEISFDETFRTNYDIIGSWSELKFSSNYPFTKLEKSRIANIRKIIKKGNIGKEDIFEIGLYDSLVAGDILRIKREDILKMHDEMSIHREKELAINGNEIKSILGCPNGPLIKEVKKGLLREVISGNLPNSEYELKRYVEKNWK